LAMLGSAYRVCRRCGFADRGQRTGGNAVILDLIAGLVSLATALAFLGVLVYKVWSIPLWIVILLGAAMMVASLIESVRSDEWR
jgi:uncharacterized protein (DUF983 family)